MWGYHLDRLSPPAAEQPMGNRSFRCTERLLYTLASLLTLLKQQVKNPRAVFWISHYSDEKLTFFLEQGHFTALNAPVTDG